MVDGSEDADRTLVRSVRNVNIQLSAEYRCQGSITYQSPKLKPTMKNEDIVGAALAEVLPVTDKWWFQQSHLLRLNLVLLVPLLSSSVAGYDGSLMNGLQSLPQVRSRRR
jgi:hypothetical protein